jgi:hypothetical protein
MECTAVGTFRGCRRYGRQRVTPDEREGLVDDLNVTAKELRQTLDRALALTDRMTQLVILILPAITAGR